MEKLDVLKYQDYRMFLADYNRARSERKRGWSLSVWTRQLGLSHASALSMILNRKRHIGESLQDSLCTYFEFNESEKKHFANLVKYEKSIENSNVRVMLLNRIEGERNNALVRYILNEGHQITRFDSKKEFAKLLSPVLGMSAEQILSLEDKTPVAPEPKALHQEVVNLLERSFDVLPKEQRQYSTSFLKMPKARLPEAIARLRAFHQEFLEEFDSKDGETLVCFQNAIFDMLKEVEKDSRELPTGSEDSK